MKNFYQYLLRLADEGVPFSLGTVVETKGSTPQKPGARAVFCADGRLYGTLGGGCLEAEARRRALNSLRTQQPEFFELRLDSDYGFDDGLICGGTAQIFVDPQPTRGLTSYQRLLEAQSKKEKAVLVTLVQHPDKTQMGDTLLILETGETVGNPRDPLLGERVRTEAFSLMEEEAPQPKVIEISEGITLYLEPHLPKPTLLIVGAGHIGKAVAHLGAFLDFEVIVLDDRPSFANSERFPEASQIIVEDIVRGLRQFPITPNTYIVIVTRGHRHDGVALREVVNSPAAYIGMIGSRRKIHLIFEGLLEEGITTPEQLARVRAPIGIEIGALTVEEIAVSIAAELVLERSRRRIKGAKGEELPPPGTREPLPLSSTWRRPEQRWGESNKDT